ncbi:hypothetical protein H9Y04_36805 [Streptomyces sp. TRM66268-LWL]|uniref:DUF58 domain-containing protein n=1 Tax=Streptomyces polyasparticus TaxID=2767826 RepID=A0ABR7SRG8_9ACTN|nr:hypothetical protein [Streptomyces polyasparticus]MBC9718101.1 hypothetical protein [Streptomyces polyasparticus]
MRRMPGEAAIGAARSAAFVARQGALARRMGRWALVLFVVGVAAGLAGGEGDEGPLVAMTVTCLLGCILVLLMRGAYGIHVRRTRHVLGSHPWTVCVAVVTPAFWGRPTCAVRDPYTGEPVALSVVTAPLGKQLPLPPGVPGVLWWCGSPSGRGAIARPGGDFPFRVRPVRGEAARRRVIAEALDQGLLDRTPPDPVPRPVPPVVQFPPRRPLFRWVALLGLVPAGLGLARYLASEGDPDVNDGLGMAGFALIGIGLIGAVVRTMLEIRAYATRPNVPALPSPPTTQDASGLTAAPDADLSYGTLSAFAHGQMLPPTGKEQPRRPDVRSLPWWRVRALLELSSLRNALLQSTAAAVTTGIWWWSGRHTLLPFAALLAIGATVDGVRAVRGVPAARALARAARSPHTLTRRYVLLHEAQYEGVSLVLFPLDAEAETLPESILDINFPGPAQHPHRGLPAPTGTVELHYVQEDLEPRIQVPCIEGQVLWPQSAPAAFEQIRTKFG